MPIPIEDYATPKFERMRERYPMSYDKNDRYQGVSNGACAERFQGPEGRYGGWKAAGYNPNHQTALVERVNLNKTDIILKPY